jgi:uncharacterized membrane protein
MSSRTRDLSLTVHILASIGWFGAVLAFLALAIAGLASPAPRLATASYLAMQLATRYAILPLCFASLATGILQSLATRWGLFRHYWVVIKLVLTLLATAVLLLHTRPIDQLATLAGRADIAPADHHAIRIQLVFDASAALIVLITATALAVYKPRGLTRRGLRTLRGSAPASTAAPPAW